MKKLIFTLIAITSAFLLSAQNISIEYGMNSFNGDLKKATTIKSGTNWQPGFGFSIGYDFKNIDIQLTGEKFSLAQNEDKILNQNNFKSKLISFSGSFKYKLNNGFILNKSSKLQPYIGIGVGIIKYETFYDKKDATGNDYFYWSDGSIRNLEENYDNYFVSKKLKRDYTYETSANNKKSSVVIPILAGVEFQTGNKISAALNLKYTVTNTDLIDNIENGGTDSYFYIGVGIRYFFNKETELQKHNKPYSKVNYKKIDKMDQDKDGVIDTEDLCQMTKKGVEVDKFGCPLDLDKDFVFDYKDKEPNSVDTAAVTVEGITISDEHFQIMYMLYHGQIYPVEDFFYENFPYIPVLLRQEMAEIVTIDTKEQRFKTSSEELKNLVKKITIIGTDGDKRIFRSDGEQKQ